jgi:hypothetical protein
MHIVSAIGEIEKRELTLAILFQIGADNFDEIFHGVLGRFTLRRHVMPDVVFHEFGHETADRSASRGEALQDVDARGIFVQGALGGFDLAANFLGAIDQVQFFPG